MMPWFPGQNQSYNSFTSNRVTAGLGQEIGYGVAEAITHPGIFQARYDDLASPWLGVRPRLQNYAEIGPNPLQSVVDLSKRG